MTTLQNRLLHRWSCYLFMLVLPTLACEARKLIDLNKQVTENARVQSKNASPQQAAAHLMVPPLTAPFIALDAQSWDAAGERAEQRGVVTVDVSLLTRQSPDQEVFTFAVPEGVSAQFSAPLSYYHEEQMKDDCRGADHDYMVESPRWVDISDTQGVVFFCVILRGAPEVLARARAGGLEAVFF